MVCRMVGLPVLSPAKTAEPIEIPFGFWASVGQRNHVLDGLYGRYVLVSKNAQLNCLSVAAMQPCQITLTTRYTCGHLNSESF